MFATLLVLASVAAAPVAGGDCVTPDTPSLVFVPPGNVGAGQSYSIVWANVANLDVEGDYVVERSKSAAFDAIVDSQETPATSASFVTSDEGTFYHRVRAVAGCDQARVSPNSAVRTVNVVAARANVIFTVQPKPLFVNVGDAVSQQVTTFFVENIGKSTLLVAASGQAFGGGQTFFNVVDPDPADPDFVVLAPHRPKKLEIHYSALSTAAPAAFQGFIYLATPPSEPPPSVTPYAFVNVKIGTNDSTAPVIRFKGQPSEYAFFPGYATSQPDSARPPITIEVENPGDTPMTVGGEVGPEIWAVPNAGWNSQAIAPHSRISVSLTANRTLTSPTSALPRYTYFTVRAKNGTSARILVQDNDLPAQPGGRAKLDPTLKSYTIAEVVGTDTTGGGRTASRIRLSNVSAAPLNADLYYTPVGADGGDASVKRAIVVVPPNDVVTLTDPLFEIFGLASPAMGQIEVRSEPDRVAALNINAETITSVGADGTYGIRIPVFERGEGVARNNIQSVPGLTTESSSKMSVVIAETSGNDGVSGVVSLFDQNGARIGQRAFQVPRNGIAEVGDLGGGLGKRALSVTGGHIEVSVTSGNGTAGAFGVVLDTTRNSGASIAAQVTAPRSAAISRKIAGRFGISIEEAASRQRFIVPGISNGNTSGVNNVPLATALSVTAPADKDASVTLTYIKAVGSSPAATPKFNVPHGTTLNFRNVLEDAFLLPSNAVAQGTLIIDGSDVGVISARLTGNAAQNGIPPIFGSVPVITELSPALTGGQPKMQRTVFFDGLEQSVDAARGKHWDLLLSEVAQKPITVTVRLYEAGNRGSPIAEQDVTLAASEQKRMSTIFAALGLDSDERRKDRTNVEVAVTPASGQGIIAATAIGIDNRTGDVVTYLLTPSGGVPPSGVSRVVPVTTPAPPSRRRSAPH